MIKKKNALQKLIIFQILEAKLKRTESLCLKVSREQNLKTMIVNSNEKIDKFKRNSVHKILCKDCNAIYIGKSDRAVEKRLKEHRYTVNYSKQSTGMAEHWFVNDHDLIECDTNKTG